MLVGLKSAAAAAANARHLGPRIMGKCDRASIRKDAVNSWSWSKKEFRAFNGDAFAGIKNGRLDKTDDNLEPQAQRNDAMVIFCNHEVRQRAGGRVSARTTAAHTCGGSVRNMTNRLPAHMRTAAPRRHRCERSTKKLVSQCRRHNVCAILFQGNGRLKGAERAEKW